MQTLGQTLDAALKLGGPDFYQNLVPGFINSNLKENYGKRPYQQEAFGRFVYYWNTYNGRLKSVPTQLLYHMATGSGKTLVMAGLILYLYERGYRNFLFFVNSTTIIEKTRDNFFNTTSSKYLFADTMSIGGKQIRLKEVDNFQATHQEDINIVFSTIQGLHAGLNTPRENSLTYDDFEDKKIVLISDEAHHINAETKKGKALGAEEREEIISWEGTVNRIFNANPDNILLEFTATADLTVPEIEKKYSDKLIFDYSLKQFRKDGYSKEVKVLQADTSPFERALQGVLLSQYRRKIFEKYKKQIKPVILFKSKTIKDSQAFFEEFANGIRELKVSDLVKIKTSATDAAMEKVFGYLEKHNISFENLISELKEDFSSDKLISVNSKDESEQKQLAVNSLEDEANAYRAVFAVDKLNEGWDVLNLFDIVRLYDSRDAKDGKPGKTTMAEAQLIGRGARYCPFQITEEQPFAGRKYDHDPGHELRICEELYYHSAYNPRYIQELNRALEDIGIKEEPVSTRQVKTEAESIPTSTSSNSSHILNGKQQYGRKDIFSLDAGLTEQLFKFNLKTGYMASALAFNNTEITAAERSEKTYYLADFGPHIVRKAINKLAFYQFSALKMFLPNLCSITEFISSANYLGRVKVSVSGLPEQITALSPEEKLEATINVLELISKALLADKAR